MLFDFANPIIDWLLPRRCLLCSDDILEDLICLSCLSYCNPHPNPVSVKDCDALSLYYFELTIKKLLVGAKFNKNMLYAHLLLQLSLDRFERSGVLDDIKSFSPKAVSFIPSHWIYRLRRGLELPSIFAYAFAKRLEIPVTPLLKRVSIERQAQRFTKTARQEGVKDAFALLSSAPKISRILLIDDIVTTGSTLTAAERVLRKVSKDIACLSIAKTP